MGLKDFIFGSGALKKAASTNDPSTPKDTSPSQSAGLDMGRLAQESADRQKAQEAKSSRPASPLSTTMTPITSPKKAKK